MAWHYRVIELGEHTWECRQGTTVIDIHPTLDSALDHIRSVAAADRPSHVFIHRVDATPVLTESFE